MTQIGFGLAAGTSEVTIEAAAAASEEAGFNSFWLNHPPNQDGLRPLNWASAATERILLGTGVVPISHRSPVSILNGVKEAELPLDRYLLGIGSGSGPHPLGRVRTALAELRSQTSLPLAVGALGPGMCRLAGREADAVLLNWLTPGYAQLSASYVLSEAQAAGRPQPRIYAYVRVAMGEAASARLQQEAAFYAQVPSYGANFARMGVEAIETAVWGRTKEKVRAGLRAWESVVDEVVIRAVLGSDQPEEALALIEAARSSL
jgi:alkanesulfonate monooxygenase SsuD/methylene tetrahydromethanopterin reductase-like flavin-dependent oxidoreductase (luciferase family)